ncbi:MAG: BspA family leucine-rich repeat surface protein [Spirochaetaceae bacterium]
MSGWDVSRVESMRSMLYRADSFTYDLSQWADNDILYNMDER